MTDPPPPVVYLSFTERQIIGEMTRTGAHGTLIARRLGMSINTYKTHLRRIHLKVERVLDHDYEHTASGLIILLLKGQLRVQTCSSPGVHSRGSPPPENHICRSA
jgi:hypothetical protein